MTLRERLLLDEDFRIKFFECFGIHQIKKDFK